MPDVRRTLDDLLAENRRRDLAFGPQGNNHVPMVLVALHRMGADAARLRRYADRFRDDPKGKPLEAGGGPPIAREAWPDRLGRFSDFARHVAYFEARAREVPVEAVLREAVPVLARGPAAAAYHGLLRLGYAVDLGSEPEILYALAYWAATWLPGPDYDAGASRVEPDALLDDIAAETASLSVEPVGSIVGRMEQVYAAETFRSRLRPVRFPEERPMERISALLLEAFSRMPDFTLLHALTSCQALRLVLPYAGDPVPCVSAYWHSVCAAWLTVRKGNPAEAGVLPAAAGADWPAVHARCVSGSWETLSGEEHAIKLAYCAWLESREYSRSGYLAVALRELDRPSPFV